MGNIVIPTLSEARAALGDTHLFNFTKENLTLQPIQELTDLVLDSKSNVDDRFDAALVLRTKDISAEKNILTALFDAASKTARPSNFDGSPTFTLAEKHTANIASVALQGSVLRSDFAAQVRDWLSLGFKNQKKNFESANLHAIRDEIKALQGANQIEPQDRTELTNKEKMKAAMNSFRENCLMRALVLCGGYQEKSDTKILAAAVREPIISDSAKIFAVSSLVGITSDLVASSFLRLYCDTKNSVLVRDHVLRALTLFSPAPQIINDFFSELKSKFESEKAKSRIALNESEVILFNREIEKIEGVLKPRYSINDGENQAELAREYAAAISWRPLVHLKSFGSMLFSERSGNFREIAEAGTNGDLITWERLRF